MEKVTIAVIGCGNLANNKHLVCLTGNPNVNLKYCVDIIEERAKNSAEKFGVKNYCTDYNEVLKDEQVEGVLICTPNYSHYTITMDALKAGKHVLCEKPITVNYQLSREMAEAAVRYNKILDIGVCNRYNKSVELIKEYIENGKLGEVYHVYCSFRSYRQIPGLGGDFTTKSVSGGGVLIDWGVHFFDLILYAIGLPKVQTVSANGYNKLGKEIKDYVYKDMWAGPPKLDGVCDVEEFITGYVRTTGASISFNGAWAQNIGKDEMFVDFLGDKAGIRMDYSGKFTLYQVENGVLQTVEPNYYLEDMYYKESDAFVKAIRSGVKNRNNIQYVLESAKILDSIYLSDESNKEIAL